MKKIILIFSAILVLILVTGCKNKKDNNFSQIQEVEFDKAKQESSIQNLENMSEHKNYCWKLADL